jgi:hypothetical protein
MAFMASSASPLLLTIHTFWFRDARRLEKVIGYRELFTARRTIGRLLRLPELEVGVEAERGQGGVRLDHDDRAVHLAIGRGIVEVAQHGRDLGAAVERVLEAVRLEAIAGLLALENLERELLGDEVSCEIAYLVPHVGDEDGSILRHVLGRRCKVRR